MWRAFKENGLQALIAKIKEMADSSMSAVSQLGTDLVGLAERTGTALNGKQDKTAAIPCIIPSYGWERDDTAEYPLYYDLPAEGVTIRDRAAVLIAGCVQPARRWREKSGCGLPERQPRILPQNIGLRKDRNRLWHGEV